MSRGRYKKLPLLIAGYITFSGMLLGMVVPLFFLRDAYLGRLADRKDDAWISGIIELTPWWMFLVMIAMIIVGATLGAFLGRLTLRKHFERAGIA
jgi:energy-coupling factor transport system substrate-specific component